MIDFIPATQREFLTTIGKVGRAAALHQAMTALGHAEPIQFHGPPQLSGAKKGVSVIGLGAWLAGMLAAYELGKAGYTVKILEYQNKPGEQSWPLRGGETYVELCGAMQKVGFGSSNYLNPGPWNISQHRHTPMHYCKQFGVKFKPFIRLNHNLYVQRSHAFGGKPVRYKKAIVDYKCICFGHMDKPDKQKSAKRRAIGRILQDAIGCTATVRGTRLGLYLRKYSDGIGAVRLPS